jgi:hypothetical protein
MERGDFGTNSFHEKHDLSPFCNLNHVFVLEAGYGMCWTLHCRICIDVYQFVV